MKLNDLRDVLHSDIDQSRQYPSARPKLAHYTSLETVVKILKTREIWLSNPLFMNDYEELVGGLNLAHEVFKTSVDLRSSFSPATYAAMQANFLLELQLIGIEHAPNFFVFCLSEYDEHSDPDGLLSMWRGYGGDGGGAALIFTLDAVEPVPGSPFILGPVEYRRQGERELWVHSQLKLFAKALRGNDLNPDEIKAAIRVLVERFLLGSLFSKHRGFHEEQEWRLVYFPGLDSTQKYRSQIEYVVGRRVEPKLKYKVEDASPEGEVKIRFDNLLHRILLGPTASDVLAYGMTRSMLRGLREGLAEKLMPTKTPYRSKL